MTEQQETELREAGMQAVQVKQWDEAARAFEQLWSVEGERDAWDGWRLAQAHYKLNRLDEALAICREVYTLDPDHSANRNLYAWTIFKSQFLAKQPTPINTLRNAMKGIARLAEPYDEYSPHLAALFKLVDALEDQQGNHAEEAIEWLETLDASRLSTRSKQFEAGGRKVEQASDQEAYYAHLTKALLEAGRYEDCISACDEALRTVTKPHYNNNIWWRRRKVLCEIELGDGEQAAEEMKRIALEKGDWFLWDELGDVLMKLNRREEALDAYFRALPGWDEMKISFWAQLSEVLIDEGQIPLAKALALASLAIRTEKGWKIPLELRTLLSRLDLDPNNPDIPTIAQARKALQTEINRTLSDQQPWFEGTIVSVLPNLKAAFIKGPHGSDNAFARSTLFRNGLTEDMKSQRVRYQVTEGFDKKKNRPSTVVTKVKI